MKITTWVNEVNNLAFQPTVSIENWLTKPFILSRQLKRHCQHLSVEVLSQQFMPVDETEQKLVESSDTPPFVRRIFLYGDGNPWTYGRVVIAPTTYQMYFPDFAALGAKLLGETLLYGNPDTKRSDFEYAVISQESDLYNEIKQHMSLNEPLLWARRSYFYIKQLPLLVTEVFLPGCPDYEQQG